MKFFESDVDEIFKKANVTKEQAPDLYDQCLRILSEKMAMLSVTMGMSFERVKLYDEQKESLVQDLIYLTDVSMPPSKGNE